MKARILFLKRVFVAITMLVSLGSFKTISGEVKSWIFIMSNGDSLKVDFNNYGVNSAYDTFNGLFVAYNNTTGDSITGINFFTSSDEIIDQVNQLKIHDKTVGNLNVYPNPSTGNFTATAYISSKSDVVLQIISLNGQTVVNTQLAEQPVGLFIHKFNQNLKEGAYVCCLKAGTSILTQKVVIVKN